MERDPSAMTPAELRCLREIDLGMTITELATVLGTDARRAPAGPSEPALARSTRAPKKLLYQTVSRWEWDIQPISAPNAEALARLIAYTDAAVAALVAAHEPGGAVLTYAVDGDLHDAEPDVWPSLPAAWHRAVAHRAAQQIPGARIAYAPRSAPEDPAA